MGFCNPRVLSVFRSGHVMTPTIIMSTGLVLMVLLALHPVALATEVHINSGGNGSESTSQVSFVASASEIVKVTTEAQMTTSAPVTAALMESAKSDITGDSSDLDKAETKDAAKKLEIIKQIRKINKDGSYTVGYEAGDGTFKIESRDVLGNIKGTYGYVDATGEIKRVSYNGNNGTSALKSFPTEINSVADSSPPPSASDNEDQEELSTTLPNAVTPPPQQRPSILRMRRPASLKFLSTTSAPQSFGPKSNYIQSIPKRRQGVPTSTERAQYSHFATAKTTPRPVRNYNEDSASSTRTPATSASPHSLDDEQPTPTTIVYARTVPTQKPLIILRPTTQATSTSHTQEQISRPDKLEINHVSKVMVMKSSDTSTSKSANNAEKDGDRKSIRGNNLRRQLAQDREDHYEAQPQQLYAHNAGEDSQSLYSPPNRPRVPSIVLAARQRAAQLQNALNSNSAPTTTTEKVYVRPPPPAAAIQYETTTSEPENNYLTQSPSGTVVQIPANQGIAQQATEDQGAIYGGQRPAPFSLRQGGGYPGTEPPQSAFRFPPPPSARGDQFLRETTPSSSKHREDIDEPAVYGRHTQQQRPRGGANYDGEANYQQGSFPVPYQQNPYGGGGGYFPGGQPGGFNFPQRPPVTTRDFEMLLQLLQYRHRFGGQGVGGGYNGGGYSGGGGYNTYNPNIGPYLSNPYQGFQQYPRSQLFDPVSLDPRYGYNNNFGGFRQFSEPSNVYSAGQSQQAAATGLVDPQPFNDQRGIVRPVQRPYTATNSNYYGANSAPAINPYQPQSRSMAAAPGGVAPYYQPDFSNVQQSYATQASTQQDYLPSEVREDLLYRMLMLAIQNPGGHNDVQSHQSPQPPQIGAFSDPIKSVINNAHSNVVTGAAASVGEGSAGIGAAPAHHSHHQLHLHHSNHRSSSVPMATRKPVRSVQIIGEAEE